ncbi:NAD(P)-dependent oxidoreductase [Paenibacillus sp. DCT19]|uniref:NAD(P)-dependent oxidoreductase n=1 Tax=Paenibacillus sp. DCT19 TaxID=2211212 RepID=UPI000FE1C8DA|nr:NAD(P)-binding domain-containing protein [Paenibacillus sp. DCT19]
MKNISIIGLGSMGNAMASVLLEKGYQVYVWNRSSDKAGELVQKGARYVSTVGEAIRASKTSIVCVSDYEASYEILDKSDVRSTLMGRTVIQLSTGSPQQARDLGEWMLAQGTSYLDGAIAASPSQIGQPEAAIFFSGTKAAYDGNIDIIESLAGYAPFLGEKVSAASTTDLAFLAYLFASYIGFFHAARIMESDGLEVNGLGQLIASISPMIGAVMKYESEVIHNEQYATPQTSINNCMITIKLLQQQAHEAGINDDFPEFAKNMFSRAIQDGYGNEEVAALVKTLR